MKLYCFRFRKKNFSFSSCFLSAFFPSFLPSFLFIAFLSVFFGCKDPAPVCGNGKVEKGEQCDCGLDPHKLPAGCRDINGGPRSNCSAHCTWMNINYTTLLVKWTLNGEDAQGGTFDTCSDIGVSEIHLGVVGAGGYRSEKNPGCSSYQETWTETLQTFLPTGEYTVSATPLRNRQVVGEMRDATGIVYLDRTTEIKIDFPLEAFFGWEDMTGDLILSYDFDGQGCTDASPIVEVERIYLSQDELLLDDFPKTRACSDGFWIHNTLPVGETLLRLEGRDSEDASGFCLEELIKIGVGGNLPINLTIPHVSEGFCIDP